MTFKEKLMQDHPEEDIELTAHCSCPQDYGYEEKSNICHADNCIDCWNREIPERGETS